MKRSEFIIVKRIIRIKLGFNNKLIKDSYFSTVKSAFY